VIFLEPATRDDVDLQWLKSEWWKLPFQLPPGRRNLIDHPNLNDPAQNQARSQILGAFRGPIVDEIPADALCRHVLIEERDLSTLYILTSWDWFLDTGRTFALEDTLEHLQHGRGGVIGGNRQEIDHLQLVEEKKPYLRDYDAERSDECLILIASQEHGPYTIIDGTHRAAALLAEHQDSPNLPWKAILIESPDMTGNRWHIGFTQASQVLRELDQLADQGQIW
jgi:hypothetical protein